MADSAGVARDRTPPGPFQQGGFPQTGGYKAHVAEPVGLVTAGPNAANTSGQSGCRPTPGCQMVADSAYACSRNVRRSYTPVVKPLRGKPHGRRVHRDDRCIDTGARTVTCPANHTVRLRPGGTAPFAKRCNGCPCGHDAPYRSVDGPSKLTNTTIAPEQTTSQRKQHLSELAAVRQDGPAWLRPPGGCVPYRSLPNRSTRVGAIKLRRLMQPRIAHGYRRLGHQHRLGLKNPSAISTDPNTHHRSQPPHHTNTGVAPLWSFRLRQGSWGTRLPVVGG